MYSTYSGIQSQTKVLSKPKKARKRVSDPGKFKTTKTKGSLSKKHAGQVIKDYGQTHGGDGASGMHKFGSKSAKGDGGQMAKELSMGKVGKAGSVEKGLGGGKFKGMVKTQGFKVNKAARKKY